MDSYNLVREIFILFRDREKEIFILFRKNEKKEDEFKKKNYPYKNEYILSIEESIKEKYNKLTKHFDIDLYTRDSLKIIELGIKDFNCNYDIDLDDLIIKNDIDYNLNPVLYLAYGIFENLSFDKMFRVYGRNKINIDFVKLKYYIWIFLLKSRLFKDEYDYIVHDLNCIKISTGKHICDDENSFLNITIMIKYMLFYYLNINFKNKYERKVAHYTNIDVGLKLIERQTKLRFSTIEFMNDPSEGKIIFDFLKIKESASSYKDSVTHLNFVSCFTFNHNSLNQFRLYGRKNHIECSGISLTVNRDFFINNFDDSEISNVYRCVYLDPKTGYIKIASRNIFSFYQENENFEKFTIDTLKENYFKMIRLKENIVSDMFDILKKLKPKYPVVNEYLPLIIEPINLLVKHCAFSDEDECRIIHQKHIGEDGILYNQENNTTYLEYDRDIQEYIENIYIGNSASELETFVKLTAAKEKWRKKPKIRVNDSPYRAHNKLNRI